MVQIQENRTEIKLIESPEDSLCHLFPMLGDFINRKPLFSLNQQPWNPPTDIYETPAEIVIKMELAGVNKDEINILLEKDILTVQGHRVESTPSKKKDYHLMEIHFGSFQRGFKLPLSLAKNNIQANYKDGFLIITIPKRSHEKSGVEIITE